MKVIVKQILIGFLVQLPATKRTSGDHSNYGIIKISKNIEKILKAWGTYYHLDSSGKPSANADVKNSQISKIRIIILCLHTTVTIKY